VPQPALSVQLGLDPSSFGNSYFVLDDPLRGVLDNLSYTLGGTWFTDISSYVKQVTISRGKSRELDRFQTGSATISLKNQDRTFDPTQAASPLYPNIVPRKQMNIYAGGSAVFSGLVDDWNLAYDVGGQSDAVAICVDGFAVLSKQALSLATATSQASGARISAVLSKSEVAWPSSTRAIDTGQQTLQADVIAQNTNVLEYLQLVESTEAGSFFISSAGNATFKDRNTASVVGSVAFADDGTGIPFVGVEVTYGTELLYNRVNVTRVGGATQTASSTDSIALYGINTLDQSGLLTDTDANALALANYLVGQYAQPELRFDTITIELSSLGTADQASVLALDLTNVVTVKFTPNPPTSTTDAYTTAGTASYGTAAITPQVLSTSSAQRKSMVGGTALGQTTASSSSISSAPQIRQYCEIIGIDHEIQPGSHRVRFKLAATYGVAFILDSSVYGKLNDPTVVLGF